MTTTNGKANGHDRPPFAEPIREQGPDNYLALRERIERQKAAEPVRTVEGKPLDVSDREPGSMPLLRDLVRTLAGRPADATLPAGMAPTKPFPMPGTSWRWLGDKASDPQPHGPKTVASLRWFCGRVEAMFDDGESCAGVEYMMTVAAWECVKTPKATAVDPLRPNGHTGEEGRLVARLLAGTTDVENDGDRGPRLPSKATLAPREVFARAAAALPGEWIPVATWILQRLPTLRETVQARTNALAETVDRNVPRHDDADKRPTSTREDTALASLWRAVLDVSRLIDPHRDVRRGGAR